MMVGIDRDTPLRRARRERSKNGCSTCKIRRVKCDETRPHCRKCTESGRQCEGPVAPQLQFIYDQQTSQHITLTPKLEVSLLAPRRSEDERRAFHYFNHCAAPIFAGVVDGRLWEDLVPQLAQTYDFVWDTIVCLSILLEHVPYSSLTATSNSTGLTKVTNREHQQALRIYHRAIKNIRQLAERDQLEDSVIALSYILFASVEFQQRNVNAGSDLLKRCTRFLTEILTSLDTRQTSIAGLAIHQVVTPFVLRRAVVMATLGDALPLHWTADHEVSDTLKAVLSRDPTLNEARVKFHNLVRQCFEVIRIVDFLFLLENDDPRMALLLSTRQSLLNQMIQWKASFDATSSPMPDVEIDWIRSYLLMYWAVCYTSLAACISPFQIIFDDYMDQFADIVEHARACLDDSKRIMKNQLLSKVDPGFIPPLYFCATKCRDPTLRREALYLMRQVPQEENPWGFVAPQRVVAKVISVEESENQPVLSKNSPDSQSAALPSEKRRFAFVNVVARQAPGGKQRQALELSRFEIPTHGSMRLFNEYTWLDEDDEEVRPGIADQGKQERNGGLTRAQLAVVASKLPT